MWLHIFSSTSDLSSQTSTIKAHVAKPFTYEWHHLPAPGTLEACGAGIVAPRQLNIIHKPDYRLVPYSSHDAQPRQSGEPVAQ
jgi:hypothetical protein